MVNISIDVTDLGGEARPGDKVVLWKPAAAGSSSHAGRVISTAPVDVFLTNGKASVPDVEPGEMRVLLQCRGVESQGPIDVTVPDGTGTVTLRSLIESQFEYAPPIVSAVQEAAANASASEEAAIRAQVRSERAADRADAKVDDAINNGANLIRNEVKQDADRAVSARQAATQSESNAAASEAAAASSASNAKTSETNAKQSETNAGDYAAVATTAATEAVDAMEVASEAAASIGDSVSRAATSAENAAQSEANAAQYESSAATHAQNATEAAEKVGTAAELDEWARAAQEAADRVGTAEQVGAWASESSEAASRAAQSEANAKASEESAGSSAADAKASKDAAAGSAIEAGSHAESSLDNADQAKSARDEVVPLAGQVAEDASATAAHRAHVDNQVDAVDTTFAESIPPYLQLDSPGGLRKSFVERGDLMVDVTDYGAVGDGVTDDTTAIQEAITAAGSGTVNFPTGKYLVSSGIAGFWQPRKRGPGILTDGTYEYYIEPFHFGHINTIWVNSDAGSDSSGDGLFPGTALASLQGVKTVFERFHDEGGRGSWKVRLSGNNFSGYTFAAMPYFRNTLVIEGDPLDEYSPVTTLKYAQGGSTFGMRFEPSDGLKVEVRNLRFEGFPGYGLIAKGGGLIRAYDCVADGCGIGFAAIRNVNYLFSRCVAQNSTIDGFRAQYSSSGDWSHCHSRNNAEHGFFISRNAVGHLDDSVAEGNGRYGLLADMNTRIATIGSSFKRNSYGVRCEGGSEWHRDDTRINNLHVGTADANGVPVGFFGNSRMTALHSIYGAAEFRIYSKYHNVSSLAKGPGSNILLANPPSTSTIPADVFMDDQKRIRVRFWGRANQVGARSVEVRVGDPNWTRSSTAASIPLKATSYGVFHGEVEIVPRGAGSAMDGFSRFEEQGLGASMQILNFAFDATSGVKVRIYANLQDAGSDIRLDGLELSVTG